MNTTRDAVVRCSGLIRVKRVYASEKMSSEVLRRSHTNVQIGILMKKNKNCRNSSAPNGG